MSSSELPPHAAKVPAELAHARLAIARLRSEHDATEDAIGRALLLHEIAVLEERTGDEAPAAKDHLAAINADPDFGEPLERLITLIERRQSYKNLGRLLERLGKTAESTEETERALVEYAAHLAGHENNYDGARDLIEQVLEQNESSAHAWLLLEVVAAHAKNPDLRLRALEARARFSEHPTWKGLLELDRARLRVEGGDVDQAIAAVQAAAERPSQATFKALRALEQLGITHDRPDVAARALEAQAALIARTLLEPSLGTQLGIPLYRRSEAYVIDATVRAADALRGLGNPQRAIDLLDKALEKSPGQLLLVKARLSAAEAAGDTTTAARLAEARLAHGEKGPLAAALHLRVAEAAAARGDGATALAAVGKALTEDPACISARTLEIDLLAAGQQPQLLAAALESTAEQAPSDGEKLRFYLLAADAYARLARDPQGAKAALSQASLYGASAKVLARSARLLASLNDDAAWYEEATKRVLASGVSDPEAMSLGFELSRARLLRGDRAGAEASLRSLGQHPQGAFLANALLAYAIAPAGTATETDASSAVAPSSNGSAPASENTEDATKTALQRLAEQSAEPEMQRALGLAASVRDLLRGDKHAAIAGLRKIHASDPSDLVAAISLSRLERDAGEPLNAAATLRRAADAITDDELGVSLHLEAGILAWGAGNRAEGLACLERAHELSPNSAASILGWALRASEPDKLEARRRALDAAPDRTSGVVDLERYALELGRGGNPEAALKALHAIDESAHADVQVAARLALALGAGDASEQDGALSELGKQSDELLRLSAASRFALALAAARGGATKTPAELGALAAGWAATDRSLSPALEWLGASLASGDRESEIAARFAVAERMGGDGGASIAASARFVQMLTTGAEQPLLTPTSSAARLINLELAAPGCDPRRRASALLTTGNELGEDTAPLAATLAGFSQLAELDVMGALESFRTSVEAYPSELIGWEGLRAAAIGAGDRATVAEACAALGDAVSDATRGAELWEEAAKILLDELNDSARGEYALSRAVERDVRRFATFDRLFRMVRARKDNRRLLELIAQRVEVADEPKELSKLFWERARALRELGEADAALAALDNVTMLEPNHVGALALSGEIFLTSRRFPEAAEKLSRLALLPEAPAQQRLMSGVAAVDIFEKKMEDVPSALRVLKGLHHSGLGTLAVRERLARVSTKAEDWGEAAQVLEQLMQERETREGRIDAARLCMVIQRDQRKDLPGAGRAARKLLEEKPDDGEAIDLVLEGTLDPATTQRLLVSAETALVGELVSSPLETDGIERLALVSKSLGKNALRQAALGALVALGAGSEEIDNELRTLDERVARLPQIAVDEQALPALLDPEDAGPITELMRLLGPVIAEALGPSLAAFSVTKKDRVDAREGLPLRNEIAAWAGALGLGEFELYVGGPRADLVGGVANEVPALVVGTGVRAPLSPLHRQAVARELFAIRRGTTVLSHREPSDVAALIVAACATAGVSLESPSYAMLAEFQRQISKAMSRKVKKLLPEVAARVAADNQDPVAWARAAAGSLDRLAAVAAGDVSWVLGGADSRGRVSAAVEAQRRAERLLSFVLSPAYLSLREELGMGVR